MAKSPRVRGVSEGEERTELLGLVDFCRSETLGRGVIICRILPVDKCQPMRGQGESTIWLLSAIIGLYSEQNVNVVLRGQSVIRKRKFGDRRTSHTFPSRIQFSHAGLSTQLASYSHTACWAWQCYLRCTSVYLLYTISYRAITVRYLHAVQPR